jgi:hypothetical protein
MFGASHRIPPGESTPLVEAHRSDPQPKPTQNTVNDTCEEIFLKILAKIKVRFLELRPLSSPPLSSPPQRHLKKSAGSRFAQAVGFGLKRSRPSYA